MQLKRRPTPSRRAADPAAAPIPGLVWAFRIHSRRQRRSAADRPADPLPHDGLLWLHFNLADARALQWLAPPTCQCPRGAALLLSNDNYQQLHTIDDCVYGVISDLVRDIDEATEETGYLRFVMTERLLISGRHQALCAVDATRRVLEGGHRIESVAALLETIVEDVADTMDRISDRIGAVARRDRGTGTVRRANRSSPEARPVAANLRPAAPAAVGPAHRLSPARAEESDDLKPALRLRAGKLAQRLDGLDHDIVEMRERSRLLQEELHLKIEEQGNDTSGCFRS